MQEEPANQQSGRTGQGIGHNVFFALLPDAATLRNIQAAVGRLRGQHVTGGRWSRPERFHITVVFLGHYRPLPEGLLDAARLAASRVGASEFELVLDRTGSFRRSRVGWLGCSAPSAGLLRLRDELMQDCAQAGIEVRQEGEFRPHLTVLREGHPLPSEPIAPIPWRVRDFVLIDSRHGGHNGYEQVGRWELEPGPG